MRRSLHACGIGDQGGALLPGYSFRRRDLAPLLARCPVIRFGRALYAAILAIVILSAGAAAARGQTTAPTTTATTNPTTNPTTQPIQLAMFEVSIRPELIVVQAGWPVWLRGDDLPDTGSPLWKTR